MLSFSSLQDISKNVPESLLRHAFEASKGKKSQINHLLSHRKLCSSPMLEKDIVRILHELSEMDSNNFDFGSGVGEREGRILSSLVSSRHFHFGHGIGRSGDLSEVQPKAIGSSLLNSLTNDLAADLLRRVLGIRSLQKVFVSPLGTGMSLILILSALRHRGGKYVLWFRIDQKSCFKAILAAGYTPIIISLERNSDDELCSNLKDLSEKIKLYSSSNIAAVISTTSCFAPRSPDNILQISKICQSFDIPHIVNNAYGLQCSKIMYNIQESVTQGGRIDAFVQSTDKNFMVPVGGSLIAGFNSEFVNTISQTYPGRASLTPTLDLFITLLGLGVDGYTKLLGERKDNFLFLKNQMELLAQKYGEKISSSKNNRISLAMTLSSFTESNQTNGHHISEIGSKLFHRGVFGSRVVTGMETKVIDSITFSRWGSHSDELRAPYLTVASSIGISKKDIELLIKKLDKILSSSRKSSTN